MKSREIIRRLAKAGWKKMKGRGKGSHTVMKHSENKAKVIIPEGEIKIGTLRSIEKTTGVDLRRE